MRISVLVDLANTRFRLHDLRNPTPQTVATRLDSLRECLINVLKEGLPNTGHEVIVRLYDGWFFEDGKGTQLFDLARLHCAQKFSTRRDKIRIRGEMAESLASSPGNRIPHTFRLTPGLTPFKVIIADSPPMTCRFPSDCAIDYLRGWLRGQCPHPKFCETTLQPACQFVQQKLVDTMIVADAISLIEDTDAIAVLSEDEDIVPGLITAKIKGREVFWISRFPEPRPPYRRLLKEHDVRFLQC